MRILYICADPGIPFWGTKGASIHVRSFSRALASAGHEVHVVVARMGRPAGSLESAISVAAVPSEDEAFFEPAADAPPDDATVLYEARQFVQNQAFKDVVNDTLARTEIDVICERYSLFSYIGSECARWHSLPFVLEVNAPLIAEAQAHRHLVLSPLARAIERHLFSTSDRVFPVSASLGEYVQSVAPEAAVTIIPNGVDLQRFELATDADEWRTSWVGDNSEALIIGFVGSLKPWHGIGILLDSFARVHRANPNAHLVLVGGGPEQTTVERFIGAHDLANNVHMTGPVSHDDIPDVLHAMDVLVAPYPEMESFYFSPLKMYEYMAAGRPIVASAIGQISEIVEDGATALLISPGDVSGLAECLLRLHADPSLARQLGTKAREVAFQLHGWNQRIAVWENEVQHLSRSRRTEAVAS